MIRANSCAVKPIVITPISIADPEIDARHKPVQQKPNAGADAEQKPADYKENPKKISRVTQ